MSLQEKLANRRVLFFSVSFFNYEKIITERLRELGATVEFYDERPSNSLFAKGIIRLKKDFYTVQIKKYYQIILEEIKDRKYDYFLLIKGEVMPHFFIEKLRRINPDIQMIFYSYDSFKNNLNSKAILKYFDKKFTFDRKDALDFQIHFRPLFYSQEYEKIRNEKSSFEFDTMFVGTAHTDRYIISEAVRNWCLRNGLHSYAFYYSPSKYVFLFKKNFDKTFKSFDINKITFQSLSHLEVIDLYKKSRAILDINHPWQKGLTMRTFEALGSGRKLITTNSDIVNYPFYDEKNIKVIERDNIELDKEFFTQESVLISDQQLYKMSLNGWLECLFVQNQDDYWLN